MGVAVGSGVGGRVGLAEGCRVGVPVGLDVGSGEGRAVGFLVGRAAGSAVGSAVGTAVGSVDGVAVVPEGLSDGLRVTRTVGLEVVGEMLGGVVLLGDEVGVWMVWTVHSPQVAAHRSLIMGSAQSEARPPYCGTPTSSQPLNPPLMSVW